MPHHKNRWCRNNQLRRCLSCGIVIFGRAAHMAGGRQSLIRPLRALQSGGPQLIACELFPTKAEREAARLDVATGGHLQELRKSQIEMSTNLVEYLLGGVGERDGLLENVADLVELLALGPVVEGAGNIDLLRSMGPGQQDDVSKGLQLAQTTAAMGSCRSGVLSWRGQRSQCCGRAVLPGNMCVWRRQR